MGSVPNVNIEVKLYCTPYQIKKIKMGISKETPSAPSGYKIMDRGQVKFAKICEVCQRQFTWRKSGNVIGTTSKPVQIVANVKSGLNLIKNRFCNVILINFRKQYQALKNIVSK